MVELFTMAYNEEKLLPHFVKFYKDRFEVRIKVFDNYSTDQTVKVAKDLGCVVYKISTEGEIRDDILLDFKNNVWKEAITDWVIVCDVDEWVDVREEELEKLIPAGGGIIKSTGFDMVGGPDTEYGVRNPMYDKCCIFSPTFVSEIGYTVGSHMCHPKFIVPGNKINYYNTDQVRLYHMRYPSKEELTDRYKEYAERLSQVNRANGWCYQYDASIQQISDHYDSLERIKTKVR